MYVCTVQYTACYIVYMRNGVQWNLSIVDTIGTQLAILYRDMSR